MEWNFRTVIRAFLVVGGIGLLAFGIATGDTLRIVIGGVALGVGAAGLVSEWRDDPDDSQE